MLDFSGAILAVLLERGGEERVLEVHLIFDAVNPVAIYFFGMWGYHLPFGSTSFPLPLFCLTFY